MENFAFHQKSEKVLENFYHVADIFQMHLFMKIQKTFTKIGRLCSF